eukprot:Pgem_evm1s15444
MSLSGIFLAGQTEQVSNFVLGDDVVIIDNKIPFIAPKKDNQILVYNQKTKSFIFQSNSNPSGPTGAAGFDFDEKKTLHLTNTGTSLSLGGSLKGLKWEIFPNGSSTGLSGFNGRDYGPTGGNPIVNGTGTGVVYVNGTGIVLRKPIITYAGANPAFNFVNNFPTNNTKLLEISDLNTLKSEKYEYTVLAMTQPGEKEIRIKLLADNDALLYLSNDISFLWYKSLDKSSKLVINNDFSSNNLQTGRITNLPSKELGITTNFKNLLLHNTSYSGNINFKTNQGAINLTNKTGNILFSVLDSGTVQRTGNVDISTKQGSFNVVSNLKKVLSISPTGGFVSYSEKNQLGDLMIKNQSGNVNLVHNNNTGQILINGETVENVDWSLPIQMTHNGSNNNPTLKLSNDLQLYNINGKKNDYDNVQHIWKQTIFSKTFNTNNAIVNQIEIFDSDFDIASFNSLPQNIINQFGGWGNFANHFSHGSGIASDVYTIEFKLITTNTSRPFWDYPGTNIKQLLFHSITKQGPIEDGTIILKPEANQDINLINKNQKQTLLKSDLKTITQYDVNDFNISFTNFVGSSIGLFDNLPRYILVNSAPPGPGITPGTTVLIIIKSKNNLSLTTTPGESGNFVYINELEFVMDKNR